MMGPEAMGFNPPNLDWWNEKVCRDYLFGTCLYDTFSNTVSCLRGEKTERKCGDSESICTYSC
jgi:hypothetical protein